MSSGRVHSLSTSITGGILTGIAIRYFGINTGLSVSLGSMIQILVGPDLDVDRGNLSYYLIRQIPFAGKILVFFWGILWKPYAVFVPHRSIFSHFPVISTFIRLGYIMLWVNICSNIMHFGSWVFWWSWPVFITIIICDTIHWLMDGAPIRAINIKN